MKHFLLVFSLLLLLPIQSRGQFKAVCFKVEKNSHSTDLPIGRTIVSDTTMTFPAHQVVSAFTLSGQAFLDNDRSSHVRVTLIDNTNMEYLVYELYPAFAEDRVATFNRTAIETVMLDNVEASTLTIHLKGARLQLDTIHLAGQQTRQNFYRQAAILKNVQDNYIVNLLNNNLKAKGMTWRAGLTDVGRMTFNEKKDLFGGHVPNLAGFEYYKSGIFVMPNFDSEAYEAAKSYDDSLYVKEWDWRNRHGRNWMSPAKFQGACGSCWAFAAVGLLESYYNVFRNTIINEDLSEQEVVSCTPATENCTGGSVVEAMKYLNTNGIMHEGEFPYQQSNTYIIVDCAQKNPHPNEILKIDGYSNLYPLTTNSIKGYSIN